MPWNWKVFGSKTSNKTISKFPPKNASQQNPGRSKPNWPRHKAYRVSISGLAAFIDAYKQEQKTNREEQKREDRGEKTLEIWTLGFVVLTTIGIFIQACILHQSDVTFRDTLIAQRDFNQRQLRAYVGLVIPINPADNDLLPPNIPSVHFLIKNFGQTPAYKVVRSSGAQILPYPLPPNLTFLTAKPNVPDEPVTVFPQSQPIQGMTIDLTGPFTSEQAARVQSPHWRFYTWGTISYEDAFKRPRYTNFCVGFYVPAPSKVTNEACSQHNDSD